MQFLNKFARLGKVALVAGMVSATSVVAFANAALADHRDFKIINRSGATIEKLWISPSSSDDWEDEMLKGNGVRNGTTKNITFSGNYAEDECQFDLKYIDANEDTWTFNKIDLCKVSELTFKRNSDDKVIGSWK